MKLLTGYASERGSTREIAERVAARIASHGHAVDVRPMSAVRSPDGYDAVVLGSAIHNQKWLPEATGFVHRNIDALAARPVWLFSAGMPGAMRAPLRRLAMREEPKVIADFRDAVRPRDHRLFSGVVHRDDLPLAGRLVFRAIGCHYGDYRDWAQIDAWSDHIAAQLTAESPGASQPSHQEGPHDVDPSSTQPARPGHRQEGPDAPHPV
jgi:menaquinone-dependent protoporphyrinogen oxidase